MSLGIEEQPVSGDKDLWYRIYDDKGNAVSVNARTGEAKVVKNAAAAKKAAGLKTAVEPNELYDLAIERIAEQAHSTGATLDDVRFLSAVHETRYFNGAWVGDEWRYFFSVKGMEYVVPARRTMITETMMDAFEPKLVGSLSAERLAEGVRPGAFAAGVTVTPEAALKGIDGVTRVSILVRDGELVYSLQDAGDELATVNARTGEVRKAPAVERGSGLPGFVVWLIGMALVALVYGSLYWAFTHSPAAAPQVPEGFNGPIPSIDEIFRGMGGMLVAGGLIGAVKRVKKAKVTDDEVRAAAAGAISYKGRPWSQTEYNMGYYNSLESLKQRGATKKQLALFEKLCADAPIKGGSFNPWSGD
jgi:hypothetical protein